MARLSEEDKVLRIQIAKRLKSLRENSGDIQAKFATENEMDRQLLNSWENTNNDRGMTIYSINRICKIINITLKDFFDDPLFK
ncbi:MULTISPECIES: helix-turn-helix domain-containing protein [Chryseobacterium]|uniref:Transcriptional regulator with XRE-family HTH domain n=1 Tax=Chryseobacterium camelliae TaxID=1265445 RepID=A0ABU0TG63_9FLAO|nr:MULTISPECIES: helix-turn-helix transcriptional regulator [Chryseobacterium]MDT3406409.1 transcriptional regulator with XRE-family HTH domain [Pseudacidovorax intermedius]MDQ1095791.1 transcriptional regulator with XRE-family HTH domain [Chryseobacterium camelliae]MDQ1099728.1 transcriptional regulator with XRE-family HTH domain [Chryseobacterium sp. SORGH_AS_1048]MDR6087076.1 transcriptional regulator with XRE-family HTH domain [Chryseobacterium sp. SORGH_AS_0909]MDR6131449.1 transcriptiona